MKLKSLFEEKSKVYNIEMFKNKKNPLNEVFVCKCGRYDAGVY